MTSFSRKRFDRAKRARAKGGRTPEILRKSGPHKPKKLSDLLRNKSLNAEWEVNDEFDEINNDGNGDSGREP